MHTASFPARFDSLESIGNLVAQAAREAGFDDNAVYEVQLAVDEAATNIIEHAYGGEGKGEIRITFQITSDSLILRIYDRGIPFDPHMIEKPKLHLKLEELSPRGLGLYWMRNLMDDVHFEFTPEQGNILTMSKRRIAN